MHCAKSTDSFLIAARRHTAHQHPRVGGTCVSFSTSTSTSTCNHRTLLSYYTCGGSHSSRFSLSRRGPPRVKQGHKRGGTRLRGPPPGDPKYPEGLRPKFGALAPGANERCPAARPANPGPSFGNDLTI